MKVYIVVRVAEDREFNQVDVFYSAHLKREDAEAKVEGYRALPISEPEFEIIEREIN